MHRCTEQSQVCFIFGLLTAVQVWISGSVPALLTSPPLVYRQSSGCPFQSDAARFTDCKCRVNISCSGALGTETLLKTRDVKNTQQLIWVHRELKDVHIHVPVSSPIKGFRVGTFSQILFHLLSLTSDLSLTESLYYEGNGLCCGDRVRLTCLCFATVRPVW